MIWFEQSKITACPYCKAIGADIDPTTCDPIEMSETSEHKYHPNIAMNKCILGTEPCMDCGKTMFEHYGHTKADL